MEVMVYSRSGFRSSTSNAHMKRVVRQNVESLLVNDKRFSSGSFSVSFVSMSPSASGGGYGPLVDRIAVLISFGLNLVEHFCTGVEMRTLTGHLCNSIADWLTI